MMLDEVDIVQQFFLKLAQVGPDNTGNITIQCIGNPQTFTITTLTRSDTEPDGQISGSAPTLREAMRAIAVSRGRRQGIDDDE